MRRRCFVPCAIVLMFTALLATISLWSLSWVGPSTSTYVSLGSGRLWLWHSLPGDWSARGPGFRAGGWTGDMLTWRPDVDPQRTIMVEARPAGAVARGPTHKVITGFSLILPLWIPLALAGATTIMCLPAWLAHRRAVRAGSCRRCGYDLRGLKDRCPECGRPIPSALRRAIGAIRALLRPPPQPALLPPRSLCP